MHVLVKRLVSLRFSIIYNSLNLHTFSIFFDFPTYHFLLIFGYPKPQSHHHIPSHSNRPIPIMAARLLSESCTRTLVTGAFALKSCVPTHGESECTKCPMCETMIPWHSVETAQRIPINHNSIDIWTPKYITKPALDKWTNIIPV